MTVTWLRAQFLQQGGIEDAWTRLQPVHPKHDSCLLEEPARKSYLPARKSSSTSNPMISTAENQTAADGGHREKRNWKSSTPNTMQAVSLGCSTAEAAAHVFVLPFISDKTALVRSWRDVALGTDTQWPPTAHSVWAQDLHPLGTRHHLMKLVPTQNPLNVTWRSSYPGGGALGHRAGMFVIWEPPTEGTSWLHLLR